MKKYLLMLATAAVALGFASCSNEKEDDEIITSEKNEIKLNISVSNFDGSNDVNDGVSTKAAKSGWVNGDKINIWYDDNFQVNPDLVIKYNGSKWIIDSEATTSGNIPAASGKIKYIYEGYNDLSKYTPTEQLSFTSYRNDIFNLTYYYSIDFSGVPQYTFEDGTISFSINKWRPLSEFQVVVTDIDADEYELKCDALRKSAGFFITSSGIASSNMSTDDYTRGIKNNDGAAFYFSSNVDTDNYTFTLKNKTTGVEYSYTATGKSHTYATFTAVKIDKSKFGL